MTEMTSRYILKFVILHDEKSHELDLEMNLPVSQPAPLPGDEIQLPVASLQALGLDKNAFIVKRRRYVVGQFPPGITSIIFLVLS